MKNTFEINVIKFEDGFLKEWSNLYGRFDFKTTQSIFQALDLGNMAGYIKNCLTNDHPHVKFTVQKYKVTFKKVSSERK